MSSEPRFPMSTLLTVAAMMLVVGALAGALTGGIAGRAAAGEPQVAVAAAPATATASPTVAATASPTRSIADAPSDGTPKATMTPAVPLASPVVGAAPAGSVAEVANQVSSAVVTVINKQVFEGYYNDGQDLQPVGSGTGFIISEDGYIVTNNHVVENSQGLDVVFDDDTKVEATLIGTDPFTDLAVVKIDGPVPGVVALGDSSALQPGDPVIAIGSALGSYTNTVTQGVISGTGRRLLNSDGSSDENMLQHDAPINPGNSGGPLLNMQGQVVGVNTAVVRWAEQNVPADGLGFAIPSTTVQQIVTLLIANGKVERPYVGVNSITVTPAIADWEGLPVQNGAYISDVATNSPAEHAGMQQGDIITSVNGEAIDQAHPFVNLLFQYKPGDTISVEAYRLATGESVTYQLTLGTRPDIP